MRGALTREVQEVALASMGREISLNELRLMPYLQYLVLNVQPVDPAKISKDERAVLALWREEGLMAGGASGVRVLRRFWDAMNAILFEAYVKPTGGEL